MTFSRYGNLLLAAGVVCLTACSSLHKHRHVSDTMADQTNAVQSQAAQQEEGTVVTQGTGHEANLSEQTGLDGAPISHEGLTYYFAFDSHAVRKADQPAIRKQADYLLAHADAKVIVEGYTDPRGSREYNVSLGERRAKAVAQLLTNQGVNGSKLRVVSYGAEKALPGHAEADYQLDRKVVIVYEQR